jgi:agmatinase
MVTREEIIATFDPSGVGLDNGNLYGLPFDYDSAQIIILGVPWEATVSYHAGTADGPDAVLQASPQLDLYDFDNPDGWCRAFITSLWETGCGPSVTRAANWQPR